MKIREVTDKDIADLLPLLDELGYPVSFEHFNIRLKRFLQNPGYGVAVCEMGKQIVGLVAWSKSSLFVSDSTRFHIEGLVVASRYRGQGIGKMLMNSPYAKTLFLRKFISSFIEAILAATNNLYLMAK